MAEDVDKLISYGRFLFERANLLGWKDDGGEGPLEYITRMAYETGWNDREPYQQIK
jgi:hypothetical protein